MASLVFAPDRWDPADDARARRPGRGRHPHGDRDVGRRVRPPGRQALLARRVPPPARRGRGAQLVRARVGRRPVAGTRSRRTRDITTGWHDVRLVPDLATLRPAAWLDRTAICVADFVEMGRDDLVAVAPRTILRRQIQHVEDAGFTPQVATELEFALYRGTYDDGRTNGYETLRPTTLARADYTVQAGDQHEAFFARVREALSASDLGPWTSQVEWGLGQWEINLEYQRALEMADRHILFKLAMRDMAAAARDVGDVHAEAVRRHDRLVVPPAPVAPERERRQRVPRRGGRARRRAHAVAGGRRAPAARARPDAVLRADGQLLPAHDERRVQRERPQLGVRQPHGLVSRARRGSGVDAAGVAGARRRREPVPRDRRGARVRRRRDLDRRGSRASR